MNLTPQIKAQAIAAAIESFTGQKAFVVNLPNRPPVVSFLPEGYKNLQTILETQMQKKADIEIDYFPVVMPIVIKKVFPYALIALGTCALIGYFVGSR